MDCVVVVGSWGEVSEVGFSGYGKWVEVEEEEEGKGRQRRTTSGETVEFVGWGFGVGWWVVGGVGGRRCHLVFLEFPRSFLPS